MTDVNRQWILRRRPTGPLTADVFELSSSGLRPLEPGQTRVRVLCLSLDPANRVWIAGPSYRPAVALDGVMDGFALGQVVESTDAALAPGDLVSGDLGWQDYASVATDGLQKISRLPDTPLSYHLGVLGVTGLTAYFGLLDIGRPKPKETVLISGAAGATGSVAGQIAKMWGCRTVGIAGRPDKCAWLTDDLGFDAAIDYRRDDVAAAIERTCPDGVDVYFDNVGGPILQAALGKMRRGGRIVCCGSVSGYDTGAATPGPAGIPGLLIAKRLRMQGFIVLDYMARAPQAVKALAGWIGSGHIKVREDRIEGLERAPEGLVGLLAGDNLGKRWVHVADAR
jgi:NADPH-dependent curcumin reductase CurA